MCRAARKAMEKAHAGPHPCAGAPCILLQQTKAAGCWGAASPAPSFPAPPFALCTTPQVGLHMGVGMLDKELPHPGGRLAVVVLQSCHEHLKACREDMPAVPPQVKDAVAGQHSSHCTPISSTPAPRIAPATILPPGCQSTLDTRQMRVGTPTLAWHPTLCFPPASRLASTSLHTRY